VHSRILKPRWKLAELRLLDRYAGVKPVAELCALLGRSERSIRCKLARQELSARVVEGRSLQQLRVDLHLRRPVVWRHVLRGDLRLHSALVQPRSIAFGFPLSSSHPSRSLTLAMRQERQTLRQIVMAAQQGQLRLTHVRITEASIVKLATQPAFAAARTRLTPAMQRWLLPLQRPVLTPIGLPPAFAVMHRCVRCRSTIRGIAFFWHQRHCN
jgi:hypothetical protein